MDGRKIRNGYTDREEMAHAFTHGIGIVLSLVGIGFLVTKALKSGDRWHLFSFIIFGLAFFYYTSPQRFIIV